MDLSKKKYFKRLGDKLNISSTTYFLIIKHFAGGKNAPIILQLLVNDKLVSSFVEKASKQCQPMSNDSTLPLVLLFEATNMLSTVNIKSERISKIIQNLAQNKAHDHGNIFVRIIKLVTHNLNT